MPLKHGKTTSRAPSTMPATATCTKILGALFAVRLVNAYYVQTFFQPDEYFQSLEPAWDLAFGPDSGAWLTWEWSERLRTSVHPLLFAGVFKFTHLLCNLIDATDRRRADALLVAPRVLQAFFAAVMDLYTWRLASLLHKRGPAAQTALVLTVVSPWQWFCSTRTFSNSLEATITAVALHSFPWKWFLGEEGHTKQTRVKAAPTGLYPALTGAAVAFYFRPTNILIWIAISAGLVWCSRSFTKSLVLVQAATIVGTSVVVAFASADRLYYGEWACPPLKFLYINVVQSLAVFYGSNRVDYYFTEGLPLLLTTALPFAAYGTFESLRHGNGYAQTKDAWHGQVKFILAFATAFAVLALSTIYHKEMRFLYPLLPILHVLAAKPLTTFFFGVTRRKTRAAILLALLATNVFIAHYTSMVHQRGVIDVMHYLRHRQESRLDSLSVGSLTPKTDASNLTVGFLMPCHSTPWRSHLVYPQMKAWALTCEPPLNMTPEQRATYLDEADIFYADPTLWLQSNMQDIKNALSSTERAASGQTTRRQWPEYLVIFEQLEKTLLPMLQDNNYVEHKRFFNTHWHDDGRRRGDVVVLARDHA